MNKIFLKGLLFGLGIVIAIYIIVGMVNYIIKTQQNEIDSFSDVCPYGVYDFTCTDMGPLEWNVFYPGDKHCKYICYEGEKIK